MAIRINAMINRLAEPELFQINWAMCIANQRRLMFLGGLLSFHPILLIDLCQIYNHH